MQIDQIYWYPVGAVGAAMDSAMIAQDGEIFGALVGGQPILVQRDGRLVSLPPGVHSERYLAAAMSSTGRYLALASARLVIVDLFSGDIRSAPTENVCQMTWRDDGRQLAISHTKNLLTVWGIDGERVRSISLPLKRGQWWVTFATNGETILAASYDIPPNGICLCPPEGPVVRSTIPQGQSVSGLVAWQDQIILASSDRSSYFALTAYSPDLKVINQVRLETAITTLSICPGQNWLAAGTVHGALWIVDAQTLQITCRRTLWTVPVRTVAASAPGCVVAGASNGRLALIELI